MAVIVVGGDSSRGDKAGERRDANAQVQRRYCTVGGGGGDREEEGGSAAQQPWVGPKARRVAVLEEQDGGLPSSR